MKIECNRLVFAEAKGKYPYERTGTMSITT